MLTNLMINTVAIAGVRFGSIILKYILGYDAPSTIPLSSRETEI